MLALAVRSDVNNDKPLGHPIYLILIPDIGESPQLYSGCTHSSVKCLTLTDKEKRGPLGSGQEYARVADNIGSGVVRVPLSNVPIPAFEAFRCKENTFSELICQYTNYTVKYLLIITSNSDEDKS